VCAARLRYHPRENVREHNYRQLARLDRRAHSNNNSRSMDSETPPSPSILTESVRSEKTRSDSMMTRTQCRKHWHLRKHRGGPRLLPQCQFLRRLRHFRSSPHSGDLSTVPTSFVTAPPTIVSRTVYTRPPARRGGHGVLIRNLRPLLHFPRVLTSLDIRLRGTAVHTVSAGVSPTFSGCLCIFPPLPSCFPLCSGRYLLSRDHALMYSTTFHQRETVCRESVAKHWQVAD
jgi:hypothetical protein